jgi:hypothetical protein
MSDRKDNIIRRLHRAGTTAPKVTDETREAASAPHDESREGARRLFDEIHAARAKRAKRPLKLVDE